MVAGVTLRQYSFKKQDYVAVQVAKQVPTTWVPVDMWVVAQRSVQVRPAPHPRVPGPRPALHPGSAARIPGPRPASF